MTEKNKKFSKLEGRYVSSINVTSTSPIAPEPKDLIEKIAKEFCSECHQTEGVPCLREPKLCQYNLYHAERIAAAYRPIIEKLTKERDASIKEMSKRSREVGTLEIKVEKLRAENARLKEESRPAIDGQTREALIQFILNENYEVVRGHAEIVAAQLLKLIQPIDEEEIRKAERKATLEFLKDWGTGRDSGLTVGQFEKKYFPIGDWTLYEALEEFYSLKAGQEPGK